MRGFFTDGPPVFALLLLGLGVAGHVASFFPGGQDLAEVEAWVAAVEPPPTMEPAVARVSLTLPVINAARRVVFLVTSATKADIVAQLADRSEPGTPDLPASLVRPAAGEPR